MNKELNDRCFGTCELCGKLPAVHEYTVSPANGDNIEDQVAICDICLTSITENNNGNYWR